MTTLPLDPYISTTGYFHNPNSPGENAYHEPPVMRSFAAAIRSEIGSTVPPPPDLSNYFTKSESNARFEQFANKAQASGYAPLDAAGLVPTVHIPPLAINDTFVVADQASMLALTAQRGDMAIRTDTGRTYVLSAEPASTLANWKEVLAAGQVTSVNGQTGVVNLTAADVGALTQTQADLLYLKLTGGALSGPLTISGNGVAVSPDAGNTLVWRANGFYVPTAAGGGGSVTVLRDEEFAPAAAATTVVLAAAPTDVHVVTRNGVAQSAAAGHYSLAGSTLTFSDAFVAGERVTVVYSVGVSVAADVWTKAEADARFVNVPGDTMTGALNWGASVSTPDVTLSRTGVGALRLDTNLGVGTNPLAWRSDIRAVEIGPGAGIMGQAGAGHLFLHNNLFLDSGGYKAANTGESTLVRVQTGFFQIQTAPSATAGTVVTPTTRLTVGNTGTLSLSPVSGQPIIVAGGATAQTWNATTAAYQLGQSSAIWADTNSGFIRIISNSYYDASNVVRALSAGPGANIQVGGGQVLISTAASVGAAGATHTYNTRFTLGDNGTMNVYPATGQHGLYITSPTPSGGIWQAYSSGGTARALSIGFGINGVDKSTGIGVFDNAGGGALALVNGTNGGAGGNILAYPYGGFFGPGIDNSWQCGGVSNRWNVIFAVSPTINTSSIKVKDPQGDLDPERALTAVLRTPNRRFNYKGQEQVFSGYYMEEADELFTIGPDQTSSGNDVGILLAAIKAIAMRMGITVDG